MLQDKKKQHIKISRIYTNNGLAEEEIRKSDHSQWLQKINNQE